MLKRFKEWILGRTKVVVIEVSEADTEPKFDCTVQQLKDCTVAEQKSLGETLKNSGW